MCCYHHHHHDCAYQYAYHHCNQCFSASNTKTTDHTSWKSSMASSHTHWYLNTMKILNHCESTTYSVMLQKFFFIIFLCCVENFVAYLYFVRTNYIVIVCAVTFHRVSHHHPIHLCDSCNHHHHRHHRHSAHTPVSVVWPGFVIMVIGKRKDVSPNVELQPDSKQFVVNPSTPFWHATFGFALIKPPAPLRTGHIQHILELEKTGRPTTMNILSKLSHLGLASNHYHHHHEKKTSFIFLYLFYFLLLFSFSFSFSFFNSR